MLQVVVRQRASLREGSHRFVYRRPLDRLAFGLQVVHDQRACFQYTTCKSYIGSRKALREGQRLSNPAGYAALQMNSEQAIHRLRSVIRRQHKALATEATYVSWLRRYMDAVQRFPDTLTSEEKLERFLTDLACKRGISASSQRISRDRTPIGRSGDGGMSQWAAMLPPCASAV